MRLVAALAAAALAAAAPSGGGGGGAVEIQPVDGTWSAALKPDGSLRLATGTRRAKRWWSVRMRDAYEVDAEGHVVCSLAHGEPSVRLSPSAGTYTQVR
jgi:hypothetical protein